MKGKCEQLGHLWGVTTARGWYCCQREVETKVVKRTASLQSVSCGAVAYCAGCLGYRLRPELSLRLCEVHQELDPTCFPLAYAKKTFAAPPVAPVETQMSFW